MSNETRIVGSTLISPSSSKINHDLAMLYLNNQDLKDVAVSELAQKYTDTITELSNAFKSQSKNKSYYF